MEQPWTEEHKVTFQLCSLCLKYPDQQWTESDEILELISSLENRGIKHCFDMFFDYIRQNSFKRLCENYVNWFDFSEKKTLYLTHNIFGENRERGLAFVKLKMEFAKAGFYLKEEELPDYLPLILEFAAIAEDEKAVQKVFMIHKKEVDHLLSELEKEDNPYGYILKACVTAMAAYLPATLENDANHHAG